MLLRNFVLPAILVFASSLPRMLRAEAPAAPAPADLAAGFTADVRPTVQKYCLSCHSTEKKEGELDLERFTSLDTARSGLPVWRHVVEQLQDEQMPPEDAPQPTEAEKQRLLGWVGAFLDAEIRARAGDPGRVVVRRLSNAEYDNTIRDLTSVDLRPTREFPGDGAAGEGFTNAGDALVMSPTLFNKYLAAAKDIASHAVLLPDGFRFSPSTTRRDWTDELIAELNATYRELNSGHTDGKLDVAPYVVATIRHREALSAGKTTLEAVAKIERLNEKYLRVLWDTLNKSDQQLPLARIRAEWRKAAPDQLGPLLAEIKAWQAVLWKFNVIGSYMNLVWQEPARPEITESHTLTIRPKPAANSADVVVYLVARELAHGDAPDKAVWRRARFQGEQQTTLLLRDLDQLTAGVERARHAAFSQTTKYLAAAVELAREPKLATAELAKQRSLEPKLLENWVELLGLAALSTQGPAQTAMPLELLAKPRPPDMDHPQVAGWGTDAPDHLPVVVGNANDKVERVPGEISPRKIAVHPTPTQVAAVTWESPIDGSLVFDAAVKHSHVGCGNGVAYWLEHRRGNRVQSLGEGLLDQGKGATETGQVDVRRGDVIVLAVGPRDGNHGCDLTMVDLTFKEQGGNSRVWDLANDVVFTITEANPHADRMGNAGVWRFCFGPDPTGGKPLAVGGTKIPAGSVLAQWRRLALDAAAGDRANQLAEQVQKLLTGSRPNERPADQALFDLVVALDSPLLQGIDLASFQPGEASGNFKPAYGLERKQFGGTVNNQEIDDASVLVDVPSVTAIRLPANVFHDRQFVVEGTVAPGSRSSLVTFEISDSPPNLNQPPAAGARCVGSADLLKADSPELERGFATFRDCFPVNLHYPQVVPLDETICLRLFFREDEALQRLFLNPQQIQRLDRLWQQLIYVSQQPRVEFKNYGTFMGFVSQESKEFYANVESKTREPVRQHAEAFEAALPLTWPKHLEVLQDFASQAWRRPLDSSEKDQLLRLYQSLRDNDMSHEEAFNTTLACVLVSPSFLYRTEQPVDGQQAQPVSNWELATRLSYFLWASLPDDQLRRAAASGRLTDPAVLAAETERMLGDAKVRGLATEFAAQWLHVRNIRDNREKNEKLFPTFDDELREALFEESVRFFEDLFEHDHSVLDILDADHTFVNETLARHYGIPGITGPEWRRVDGAKKYGRGGVLGLASVLAAQSGASRTSPVLRGNWLVETLLGEKTPKPPANVPRLPDEETGGEDLTVRQMVEKHAHVAECAVCHQRIDPFGFALEKYDAIGRLREKDIAGRALLTNVQLKDGTKFDGAEGLRQYLNGARRQDVLRQFCRKLVGYALGRSVSLSDEPLVDQMLADLAANEYRFSAAVQTLVASPQFRQHRGLAATTEE